MALFRKKSSGQPQSQQPQQQAPAAPPAASWTLPADWREQLTAAKPKGRFTYGENVKSGTRR